VLTVAYFASAVAAATCIFSFIIIAFKCRNWTHNWIEYAPGVSVVAVNAANVLYLLGRVLNGVCEDDDDESKCNPIPGALPVCHSFSLLIGIFFTMVICRRMIYTFKFLSALFNCFGLSTCALIACPKSVAIGICIQCAFVYFIVLSSAFQDMTTFEYYLMAQHRFTDEITQRDRLAELEKRQLKLVLADAAHDLKTPLIAFNAGIHTVMALVEDYLRLVTNSTTSAVTAMAVSIREACVDTEDSGVFMMMQINRALDEYKIDNNVRRLAQYETVNIGEVVKWTIRFIRRVLRNVNVDVAPSCGPLLQMKIFTDKFWLQENILCLLSNAAKYSRAGSPIVVALSLVDRVVEGAQYPSGLTDHADFVASAQRQRMLLVEVEDSGIGVPPAQRERLFQPFAQTMRSAGGKGLGLYSLALRVQELKGFYGVRAPADHAGSVFYFGIPYNAGNTFTSDDSFHIFLGSPLDTLHHISTVLSNEDTYSPEGESKITSGQSVGRTIQLTGAAPVVLIVDDSPASLKLLSRSFGKEGVTVETACDGLVALNLMKNSLYTAVIMDVYMPVMDGIESVRHLREWERGSQSDGKRQYIITVTAGGDESTKWDSLAAGTDVFVAKPLNFLQLMGYVKAQHNPV
jgi:signal transduction histidine kinase/CheY-like chemotaxis protein